MQEAFAQLISYGLGLWRHRWLALMVAWVIALAGWLFVARMPESYEASARVYVDTNSVLRPLMKGLTVTPNVNERIAMMSRMLLSRPNLEKLARMTDLDLHVTDEAQQEALIKRLKDSISLSGVRGNSSLYLVSVTDRDRETARRIAQALINIFIDTSMRDKHKDSSGAATFLEQQLTESERRLIEAENRLALFKQDHADVLPGDSGDYYSRLQAARGKLEQARLELQELQNRKRELRRQIDGEEPVFIAGGLSGTASSPLDNRIHTMQMQLDALLTRFTEKHPDIRRLRGLIAELQAERQSELEAARRNPPMYAGPGSSPVYQGMRTMLAETEAQIAEREVRVAEFERRVEELAAKVNEIPRVEAELTQLNRDYSVLSRQHQQLLERRESARLSGDVEKNAGDLAFRVIDPPFVPRQPSHPDKALLNAGVLVAALGGGGGTALLIALLFPVVTDGRMLTHHSGLPLLGTVTFCKSREQLRRERWWLAGFSALGCALLIAFVGVSTLPGLFT